MSLKIVFVSNTGMFECMLVMSREASVKCGAIGVSCNFWSRSVAWMALLKTRFSLPCYFV